MKNVLPVIFIAFINTVVHTVHWKLHGQRLNMCIGTLSALVMFHVNLINQLPPVPRMTLSDSFMLSVYALNFISWCMVLFLVLLVQGAHANQTARDERAEVIWKFFRFLGPLITISVVVAELSTMHRVAQTGAVPSNTLRVLIWAFVVPVVCPGLTLVLTKFEMKPKSKRDGGSEDDGDVALLNLAS